MNGQKSLPTRFWVIALSAAFALLAGASLLLSLRGPARLVARVEVDGQLVRRVDLAALTGEISFSVSTPGGENVVSARPGGVRIARADCPDQVCVNMGWLTGGRVPIVCLPHRLVITLEEGGQAEDELDAVAG